MSLTINNGLEKKLQEENIFQLREIFDILEGDKKNEDSKNQNNPLFGKYEIKNINLKNIKIIEPNPKNRYKLKLQKILFKKK